MDKMDKKIKRMERLVYGVCLLALLGILAYGLSGCEYEEGSYYSENNKQLAAAENIASSQGTPTDIEYSLERHNLIKRTYWVNGQREKASTLPCEVEKPLGYIVLFTESGQPVGNFTVDGKVTSLNSYLTPDSEYYGDGDCRNRWLADVDGSYGENDDGIFFFTPDGKYIEWTGVYLYSDIPFDVKDTLLTEVTEE